jgi:hypothetical protein
MYSAATGATVSSNAQAYGAVAGGKNQVPGLSVTMPTPITTCLNVLLAPGAPACNGSSTPNAVKVTQNATMPTYFLRAMNVIPGVNLTSINISTTATASMGNTNLWNVAIVVDTTGSMAVTDSNCTGSPSELQCALTGIQTLLGNTPPCASADTCSSGQANMRVALFTFPNVIQSSVTQDINCAGNPGTWQNTANQPTAAPYTLPQPGKSMPKWTDGTTYMQYKQTSTGTTWNATYQVTPFLADYYSSTATGHLNPNSNLVKAVGYGTTKGCLTYTKGVWGMSGGGSGFGNTYFASSIYAAQSALADAQAANPGSQNALIFLSDGQANASYYGYDKTNTTNYGAANGSNQYTDAIEFPQGAINPQNSSAAVGPGMTSYMVPATLSTGVVQYGYDTLGVSGKGLYPDWYDQCQQAIVAGQYATTNGTTVYSVAYGPESSGCGSSNTWPIGLTDTTVVVPNAGNLRQPITSSTSVLPCTTMEDMASSWSSFYADNQQTGNVNLGCTDSNHTTISLQSIFTAIGSSFRAVQLLPNNVT